MPDITLTTVVVPCLAAAAAMGPSCPLAGWEGGWTPWSAGAARCSRRRALVALLVVGLGMGIGFYDGLVGPGTGTFLALSLVALERLSLLTAAATAKVVNVGTNLGALVVFSAAGTVPWQLAPWS